ncbi:hypothetical protein G7Z17_g5294 [Cylindrodendrum hubeiense]|uniref:Uncharacterized protein n=1 Tax=Cylindrodendrum hubeiense TaxID=595255 RepID=A0A9P5HCD3_9HYPO|nr:hypothetical protein G7Z17_g5294 [Cylindrodendrum hubeiense]
MASTAQRITAQHSAAQRSARASYQTLRTRELHCGAGGWPSVSTRLSHLILSLEMAVLRLAPALALSLLALSASSVGVWGAAGSWLLAAGCNWLLQAATGFYWLLLTAAPHAFSHAFHALEHSIHAPPHVLTPSLQHPHPPSDA